MCFNFQYLTKKIFIFIWFFLHLKIKDLNFDLVS